jgi:adenylyltransferase/sulfurtransferase
MQISVDALKARLTAGDPTYLVDVREEWEHQLVALPDHVLIPLHELPERLDEIRAPDGALVVTYCHHGVRSLSAAAILRRAGVAAVSLQGGIDAWSLRIDGSLARY